MPGECHTENLHTVDLRAFSVDSQKPCAVVAGYALRSNEYHLTENCYYIEKTTPNASFGVWINFSHPSGA